MHASTPYWLTLTSYYVIFHINLCYHMTSSHELFLSHDFFTWTLSCHMNSSCELFLSHNFFTWTLPAPRFLHMNYYRIPITWFLHVNLIHDFFIRTLTIIWFLQICYIFCIIRRGIFIARLGRWSPKMQLTDKWIKTRKRVLLRQQCTKLMRITRNHYSSNSVIHPQVQYGKNKLTPGYRKQSQHLKEQTEHSAIIFQGTK